MFSANSSSATRLFVVTTPQKFVLPSVHRVHVITFLMLRCVLPLPCLMFELVVRCAVLLCAVSCLPVSRVLSCLSLLSLLSLFSLSLLHLLSPNSTLSSISSLSSYSARAFLHLPSLSHLPLLSSIFYLISLPSLRLSLISLLTSLSLFFLQ
jgi:hypothetical protein